MATHETTALDLAGSKVRDIPVTMSYRIIDLFSEGLYSSPTKAVEELVANSYDALAHNVHVFVPDALDHGSPIMWVVDDGTGMDADTLVQLWEIGESRKRDAGRESKERPPIGKFGIGKLATYVLARKLTYVCKADGKYRAVTMDFERVPKTRGGEAKTFNLDLRELNEAEAEQVLAPLLAQLNDAANPISLFGGKAAATWTVAAMTDFKPFAHSLKTGRLRWVLSTALPLNPQFKLYLNGKKLASSHEKVPVLNRWTIGLGDEAAEELEYTRHRDDKPPTVAIPDLGKVHGEAILYEEPLTGGKAENWGRSHGIFVMVRGRLINMDDPLFGLPQLSHGPFVRFRMIVHADCLDSLLRSSRETVYTTKGVANLHAYMQAKFNQARAAYNNWIAKKEREEQITNRVGIKSFGLTRAPLIRAVKGALSGGIESLFLTKLPDKLTEDERKLLSDQLDADMASEQGPIRKIEFKLLGPEYPIALYEVAERTVWVNMLHPFYANYSDHYSNPEPFELVAVGEVLTEAYLHEHDVDAREVRAIMERRDKLLRSLVFDRELGAPLVVQLLEDSTDDEKMLERAVAEGFKALGFEVSPIGGAGKPDGIAAARLGVRDEKSGERADYKISYDAKSTGKERVKAKDLNAAGVVKHRSTYKTNYSLIVAPAFEGELDPKSTVYHHAEEFQITMMKVSDFILLIWAASTRQLGFSKIREIFELCRGPKDATSAIAAILAEKEPEGPLEDILNAIWELQNELPDPVRFAALQMRPELKRYRQKDIKEWMLAVSRFAGKMIDVAEDVVRLEAPPTRILKEVRRHSAKMPKFIRDTSMYSGLPPIDDPERSST